MPLLGSPEASVNTSIIQISAAQLLTFRAGSRFVTTEELTIIHLLQLVAELVADIINKKNIIIEKIIAKHIKQIARNLNSRHK